MGGSPQDPDINSILGDFMNQAAAEENIKTLAAIAGLSHTETAKLLDHTIAITFDSADEVGARFAGFVQRLLARTITNVAKNAPSSAGAAVEIVIGQAAPATQAKTIYVGLAKGRIGIGSTQAVPSTSQPLSGVFLLLGACYAAARAVKELVGDSLHIPYSDPLVLRFDDLFGNDFDANTRFDLGTTYMAGAGAIANGFLLALSQLNVTGKLHIADVDVVTDGNLNRCVWFSEADVGQKKAERLVELAQPDFPHLNLIPHDCLLQKVPAAENGGPWLKRLIVAVDSRKTRRKLQSEIPGEVYDASTTDIREIVLHFNQQPLDDLACLSCIYHHVQEESAHEQHVARALGVTEDDLSSGYVSRAAAEKIAQRYPQFRPDELEAAAYDSLFKKLCGEGQIKGEGDRAVLAPFSFVSVMAGVYLAIELARRIMQNNPVEPFNYWKLSPWFNPIVDLKRTRRRRTECEFCGNPILMKTASELWRRD